MSQRHADFTIGIPISDDEFDYAKRSQLAGIEKLIRKIEAGEPLDAAEKSFTVACLDMAYESIKGASNRSRSKIPDECAILFARRWHVTGHKTKAVEYVAGHYGVSKQAVFKWLERPNSQALVKWTLSLCKASDASTTG